MSFMETLIKYLYERNTSLRSVRNFVYLVDVSWLLHSVCLVFYLARRFNQCFSIAVSQ